MRLNDNIKLIRELSGQRQGDFAKLIKTNLSNLKTYENTDVKPKANVLARIADIAGIEISDLLNKALSPKDIRIGVEKVDFSRENIPKDQAGYVPASDMIAVLKEQNEFLRRNFELSLESILEGQQQTGIQLKALTWYAAMTANKGDQQAMDHDLLKINNKIASYEGIGDEGDSLSEVGNKGISRKRRQAG